MAVWTKAKLAEATDLRSVVLGGAIPFTATNFMKDKKLVKKLMKAADRARERVSKMSVEDRQLLLKNAKKIMANSKVK